MKYLPEMQIDAPAPRWTPGSLAEHIGQHGGGGVFADAVERLVRAARAAVDYMDEGDGFIRAELMTAVKAAEKWNK